MYELVPFFQRGECASQGNLGKDEDLVERLLLGLSVGAEHLLQDHAEIADRDLGVCNLVVRNELVDVVVDPVIVVFGSYRTRSSVRQVSGGLGCLELAYEGPAVEASVNVGSCPSPHLEVAQAASVISLIGYAVPDLHLRESDRVAQVDAEPGVPWIDPLGRCPDVPGIVVPEGIEVEAPSAVAGCISGKSAELPCVLGQVDHFNLQGGRILHPLSGDLVDTPVGFVDAADPVGFAVLEIHDLDGLRTGFHYHGLLLPGGGGVGDLAVLEVGDRGRKVEVKCIDNLLIGNKSALKEKILLFTEENPGPICLAYLLKALTMADAVKKNISYATFHRAIEQFTGRKIGIDTPRKRYGELKDFGFHGPQKGSWARAKAIIYHWSDIFASVV